jgi:hypothetical protein
VSIATSAINCPNLLPGLMELLPVASGDSEFFLWEQQLAFRSENGSTIHSF